MLIGLRGWICLFGDFGLFAVVGLLVCVLLVVDCFVRWFVG